jgi:O-antigen biosynthesis protein
MGSNPPEDIIKLAGPNVQMHGFVETLGTMLDQLRLTVVPLRYGAGTKGKVLTAMAAGIPSVVSPIAAEGMGLTHRREVLIAEKAEDFAQQVIELYENKATWVDIVRGGEAYVNDAVGPPRALDIMQNILGALAIKPIHTKASMLLYDPARSIFAKCRMD